MLMLLVPASRVKPVTVAQFQIVPVDVRVQVVLPIVKARVTELEELNTVELIVLELVLNPPEVRTTEPATVKAPTK
jgi:hypothetical protein